MVIFHSYVSLPEGILNHIDSIETLLVCTRNPGLSRHPGRNHKVLVLDIENPANASALALDKGALRWSKVHPQLEWGKCMIIHEHISNILAINWNGGGRCLHAILSPQKSTSNIVQPMTEKLGWTPTPWEVFPPKKNTACTGDGPELLG